MFDTVFSIITMIAMVAVIVFYFFFKREDKKDWVYAVYFLTVIVTGIVLYYRALVFKNDEDSSFSGLFMFAKACTKAFREFGADFGSDVNSAYAKSNPVVAAAFFVHFISAMTLTFLVAIKLFGKSLINKCRVYINSLRSKYIVVGSGVNAETFLRSLSYKQKRRTTVILEASNKKKRNEFMFSGFAVLTIENTEVSKFRKYFKSKAKKPKEKADLAKDALETLKTAGFDNNKYATKIVTLSESDECNMLVAKIVTDYISDKVKPVKNKSGRIEKLTEAQEAILAGLKLEADIMYTTLERTEHFAFSEYALGRVRFFNPHEVRARKFMQENPITSLIPQAWINTEKARLYGAADGKKARKIGNIFVGYGETNQQIFKKCLCHYQLLDNDFNALVIDKSAKEKEKQFQNNAPGLFVKQEGAGFYESPVERFNIAFADLNVQSCDFYNRVIQEIEGNGGKSLDLAVIIIALGSDKLSIETALELRQKLYEKRLLKANDGDTEYARVRIFVKIINESTLTDYTLLNDKNDIDAEIVTFGAMGEVLTEEYVIEEKPDVLAKNIANDYWQIAQSGGGKTNCVSKWDTLTEFKRESNRYAAMSIKMKLNLLGFDLIESEHEGEQKVTEPAVAEKYKERYGMAVAERQRKEKAAGAFVDFAERDAKGHIIDNARNNLARLEHQRWNTFHFTCGWTKLPKSEVTAETRQDEKSNQHACLTTFEGLTELRKAQAEDAVKRAKAQGVELSLDKALSDADTICYDFDLMDRLIENLQGTAYYVVALGEKDTKKQ